MEYFDIKSPEITNRLIIENKLAFAFPSKKPIVPGHTLICPKRCITKIDDLSENELCSILDIIKKIKRAMIKSFGAQGFNYAWNEGEIAGQSVKHLHIHMLPRKQLDKGIYQYEPRKFLYRPGERPDSPDKELIGVANLIKKNLL